MDTPNSEISTENQDEEHVTYMSYQQVIGKRKLECLKLEDSRNKNERRMRKDSEKPEKGAEQPDLTTPKNLCAKKAPF